jgi:MFS transporter, FHS family, Na+ dependent glucose transporter 1
LNKRTELGRPPSLLGEPALQRTASYYLLIIYLGLSTAIIGPTLPALAAQTRTLLGDMGLVFLASSAGFTLGTALTSRVLDRVPGHLVLGLAQLAAALMLVLVPFAPNLPILLAILALSGFAVGFVNATANTLLVWVHRARVGPYMNGMHFFFGVGAFAGPFIVAQVVGLAGGYRWVFWAVAVVGIVASLRVLSLRESPRPEHHPTATDDNGWRLEIPIILSSALFLFFYVGAEVAFGGWVYTYAITLNLAAAAEAAYLTSAFWGAFTIGRLISIPLATRLTAQKTILASLGGCLALLAGAIVLARSNAILWVLAVGLGLFMAPIWPTGYTLAGQSVKFTARASGLILLGDSFGGMVLPWLSGHVIELAGAQAMIYLVSGSLVCTLVMFGAMQYWRASGKTQSKNGM